MAAAGAPEEYHLRAEGVTLAIVATRWNARVVESLTARAATVAREFGAQVEVFHVDGALDLPVVVQACARRYDAVVALGCVIRGKTAHFNLVCDSLTTGLTRIALDEETPIGHGVLTVDDEDQAYERAGGVDAKEDRGADAVRAALSAAVELGKIRTFPVKGYHQHRD